MSKLKDRKLSYKERWENEPVKEPPPVISTPNGERVRKLIDKIRREHRTRRPYPDETEED